MDIKNLLLEKVNHALLISEETIKSKYTTQDSLFIYYWVKEEDFKKFESFSLSFIISLYGEKHPYFEKFKNSVTKNNPTSVEAGIGILKSIKTEIEKNWIKSLKDIISADIFTDFLEMAAHLLEENYEHPAAVMIGSVLEEHLRNLCIKKGIEITEIKHDKPIPKKADLLNAELVKNGIYNKLDQKNITAWLDLRNKAAHGKYNEYNIEQVKLMYNGVSEFIARTL